MALAVGSRLGHYDVTAKIGEGGMGEVYRARVASVHGVVQNLFRVGLHLLPSAHHRLLRTWVFAEWDAVTCAY